MFICIYICKYKYNYFCSSTGSNRRLLAHKTNTLTTELQKLLYNYKTINNKYKNSFLVELNLLCYTLSIDNFFILFFFYILFYKYNDIKHNLISLLEMTKNKTVKYHPFVSIICVTFNRRPFFPAFFQCIRNQDYPASRYEVIIVDDGTDKIKDLVEQSNIPQIKYFSVDKKMTLGNKRNYSHTLIDKRSKFISYFDDDDYHCPCRISHAVEMLEKNPKALCGGTSELYLYFKHIKKMIVFGPYNANHATAGTFTFRRELLEITEYDSTACFGEEKLFLKDYTIPFVQFDALKTILVISHLHNTCDKKDLLTDPLSPFTRESNVTVDMFMSRKNEASIKNFFMNTIDQMLLEYDLGSGKHKPETMLKLEELKLERAKSSNNNNNNNVSFISIQRENEEPIHLSQEQVVQLLRDQQNEINQLKQNDIITIQKDGEQPSQISIQQASQLLQEQQNEIIHLKKYIDELTPTFVTNYKTHKEHLTTKEIHL